MSYSNKSRPQWTQEEEERLSRQLRATYGLPLVEFLDRCFSKKAHLSSTCDFKFYGRIRRGVPVGDLYNCQKWKNEVLGDFMRLKNRLNEVKERLSGYNLNDWHRHTRSTNPADMVMRRLRSDVKVEFLTQAWCKFYEVMSTYNLVPRSARKSGEFYTMHLCEAPGAFVASLNHFLTLNYPNIKWWWRANSLNPFYEGNHLSSMINDDRFMLQTIRNWNFGPDLTGDITHPAYPNYFREFCGDRLAHLVTADGSFDCQDKPEEQENMVSWLHFKEVLLALRILRKGGHFVLKMFTFFECDAICLLYLLRCVFEMVDVIKPTTSKEGNSEVYVVCREYKDDKAFEPYLLRLMSITEEQFHQKAMFPLEVIHPLFLKNLYSCAEKFAKLQMSVIERNIRLYPETHSVELRTQFEFVQEKLFDRFVEQYEMQSITREENIVPMPFKKYESRFVTSKVIEERERRQGSHNDQLKRSALLPTDLLNQIIRELPVSSLLRFKKTATLPKVKLETDSFRLRMGKPIETVYSSQFCHGTFMRFRNELMKTVGANKYWVGVIDYEGHQKFLAQSTKCLNVCDFVKEHLSSLVYHKVQSRCFAKLYDRLTQLKHHDDLLLFGFPTLTQFSVSVLLVLRQIFEEVTFEPPNILYLRDADDKRYNLWMRKLCRIIVEYDKLEAKEWPEDVISLLPLETLTGVGSRFYDFVIEMNNAKVSHEISLLTQYVL